MTCLERCLIDVHSHSPSFLQYAFIHEEMETKEQNKANDPNLLFSLICCSNLLGLIQASLLCPLHPWHPNCCKKYIMYRKLLVFCPVNLFTRVLVSRYLWSPKSALHMSTPNRLLANVDCNQIILLLLLVYYYILCCAADDHSVRIILDLNPPKSQK